MLTRAVWLRIDKDAERYIAQGLGQCSLFEDKERNGSSVGKQMCGEY